MLAVFWFVTTVYVLSLRAQTALFSVLWLSLWWYSPLTALAWLSSGGRRLIAVVLCGLIIFANFALVGLRAPPLQVEHELVKLVGSVDEELWVPPHLFEKIGLFTADRTWLFPRFTKGLHLTVDWKFGWRVAGLPNPYRPLLSCFRCCLFPTIYARSCCARVRR